MDGNLFVALGIETASQARVEEEKNAALKSEKRSGNVATTRKNKRPATKITLGGSLRLHLHNAYGGFRDRRIKNLDTIAPIKVDNQNQCGHRDFYEFFCRISVLVPESATGEFILELTYPPLSQEVKEVVEAYGGRYTQDAKYSRHTSITITLSIKEAPCIRKLADAFRTTIGRNRTEDYLIDNWKFVCRRTADALKVFHRHLMTFRRSLRESDREPNTRKKP